MSGQCSGDPIADDQNWVVPTLGDHPWDVRRAVAYRSQLHLFASLVLWV
jgi:hypothetical protein